MKNFINSSSILALSVAILSSSGLTSCVLVKAMRNSSGETAKKVKKTKISEEDKAKAKAKLANAKTVGTPKKNTTPHTTTPILSVPSDTNSNLETLPMPVNQTGLIDPEVDDIPTAKELEEVEAPTPKASLPSVTIPGQ